MHELALPRNQRAQTTLDFMIGMGVFLFAILFLIGVIPSIIDPFSGGQATPLVADRVASEVAEGMLVEPGTSSVLNETCTYAFFNFSLGKGTGCVVPFDEQENDLSTRLTIDDRYSINISIRRNVSGGAGPDILCTNGDRVSSCGSIVADETRFTIGPPPAERQTVTATKRAGYLDGKDVIVVVKLW